MKHTLIPVHALCLFLLAGSNAVGQMLVNGDFANDIAGEASTMSGSVPDIGGDGSPIDDGWIEGRPGDDNWDLGSGTAVRSGGKDNPFNPIAIGQIFSNPASGGFESGDTITYSLDYDLTSYSGTFRAVLYGVTGPRDGTSWATFGGEGINLNAGVDLPAGGSDYDFFSLVDVNQGTVAGNGTFSQNVILGNDYSYFFAGFAANPGTSNASNSLTLSNVSVSVVPEPSTAVALLAGIAGLLVALRRLRRR